MKKLFILLGMLIYLFSLVSCSETYVSESNSNNATSSNTISESSSIIPEVNVSSVLCPQSPLSNYEPEAWEYPLEEYPKSWGEMITEWNPPKRELYNVDQTIEVDGINKDIFPVVTNSGNLKDLMSPMYSLRVMSIEFNCNMHVNAYTDPLAEIFDRFPVSFLRKTGKGQYYTVNKVYDGGYAYIFFDRPKNYETGEYLDDDETNVIVTGCVYAEKSMRKSDFDSIKIGDSIDKVIEVDHATTMTKTLWDYTKNIGGNNMVYPMTKHLLTDGLLVYEYGYTDNDIVVSGITYFEDFNFVSPIQESLGENSYVKYYGILPQDYPPET